jgi:hypothetical protein
VGPALVSYAAGATLLVVGSNGPGGAIPLSLGAILGEVTSHSECPVMWRALALATSKATPAKVANAEAVANPNRTAGAPKRRSRAPT